MGFQNEEDYLDNLLKSITENKDSVSSEELLSTDSKMKIPDTFEPIDYEPIVQELKTMRELSYKYIDDNIINVWKI